MKPEVELYDTTLRDGSQGEGINFSVIDKLRIAEKLDAFGFHYIEGGWPGSNPKDIAFFAEAKRKKFKNARLAAFGANDRPCAYRMSAADQLLGQQYSSNRATGGARIFNTRNCYPVHTAIC